MFLRRRWWVLATLMVAALGYSFTHTEQDDMWNDTQQVTSADGTVVAFSKRGSGPPLIIVDGAFCYRENGLNDKLVPLLAEHFTVYAYDRRGRGESGPGASAWSIAREIEDLQALVTHAGGTPYLVGLSSGAVLVLNALEAGVPAQKAILFEPPMLAPADRKKSMTQMREELQALVAKDDRPGAVRYFMSEVFGAPGFFVAIMPWVMRASWKRNEAVAHTLPNDLRIVEDTSVLERAATVKVPAVVLGGGASPRSLQDAVTRVAKAIPGSQTVFMPGQNHMVKPEVLVRAVTEAVRAP